MALLIGFFFVHSNEYVMSCWVREINFFFTGKHNRSAELPTKCAPVNYCGTQAPLWLHLDRNKGHRLPELDEQVNVTACASWSLVGSHQQRPHQLEQHCCSIEYPTVVRNCSTFLVYHLQPPHGCNMAYCAQPTGKHDHLHAINSYSH